LFDVSHVDVGVFIRRHRFWTDCAVQANNINTRTTTEQVNYCTRDGGYKRSALAVDRVLLLPNNFWSTDRINYYYWPNTVNASFETRYLKLWPLKCTVNVFLIGVVENMYRSSPHLVAVRINFQFKVNSTNNWVKNKCKLL